MKPQAWIWYWRFGWVLGAALLVLGIVNGDVLLIVLGLVGFVAAAVMPRWWRRRMYDGSG